MRVVQIQLGIGLALLGGAALSWMWSSLSRPYLLLVALALIGAVAWYSLFAYRAFTGLDQLGVKRFGHAPGVLAFALAFAFRLLVDLGAWSQTTRESLARPAGIGGLVLGGLLDALVIYWMLTAFWKA